MTCLLHHCIGLHSACLRLQLVAWERDLSTDSGSRIQFLRGGVSGPCYPRRWPRGPTQSMSWCFYARPKVGLESPAFHPNPPTVHPPGLLPVPPCAGSCGVGRTGIGAASPFTHCPPRASPRGRVGPDVLVRCPYSSRRGFLLFSRWSPLVPKLLLGPSHPACSTTACRSVRYNCLPPGLLL